VTVPSKSWTILAAALLCAAFPALGQQLPDGPGRELAEANCNICHTLSSRVGAGYTPEGWNTVLQMMINQGAPLPADQIEPLKAYLIKSFPEKGKPAGVVIPGPASISFREWQAPTPGSRPHDPLAARDGSLWYTGQLANLLGRVDPSTGEIRGIPPQDRAFRTTRPEGGFRRQHLVHRQHRLADRQARSEDRRRYRVQDPGGGRSAHLDLRQGRHPVVHDAERQPDRASRPQDQRDQALDAADGQCAALWHGAELEGHRVLR
jgi:hypothetical protein